MEARASHSSTAIKTKIFIIVLYLNTESKFYKRRRVLSFSLCPAFSRFASVCDVFLGAEGGTSISRRGGKCSSAFGGDLLYYQSFSVAASHPFKSHVNKKKHSLSRVPLVPKVGRLSLAGVANAHPHLAATYFIIKVSQSPLPTRSSPT